MKFDLQNKCIEMSIRELAGFGFSQLGLNKLGGVSRALIGQEWHNKLQEQVEKEYASAQFELQLKESILIDSWKLTLNGRIDQLIHLETQSICREIKTINTELPLDEEELQNKYPQHFNQAAIYAYLSRRHYQNSSNTLQAELFFISIENEKIQNISISEEEVDLRWEERIQKLLGFAKNQYLQFSNKNTLKTLPAFDTLREGQAEAIQQLQENNSTQTILFEAPTGFGKTGILLDYAINALKNNDFDRIIYLTSKTTGQLPVIEQIEKISPNRELRFLKMKSHSECLSDHKVINSKSKNIDTFFVENDLDISDFFVADEARKLEISQQAIQYGISEHRLLKELLVYAAIWIGDFNYVFSNESQFIFTEQINYDPSRSLLIIDEAHNLNERIQSSLSFEINANKLSQIVTDLRFSQSSAKIIQEFEELEDFFLTLPVSKNLNQKLPELSKKLQDIQSSIHSLPFEDNLFSEDFRDQILDLLSLSKSLKTSHEFLFYSNKEKHWSITCLDASQSTQKKILEFKQCILSSATLSPIHNFLESAGIQSADYKHIVAHANWRNDAYNIAIDQRVDTRYKNRAQHYETTAQSIALIHQASNEPVACFFPSYLYAKNIKEYMKAMYPSINIGVQPRYGSLQEKENFIDESLLSCQLIFLVFGSSFSEGLSHLGGKIEYAIIIGLPLPEVNPVQDYKMNLFSYDDKDKAFEENYLIPASKKVNQALGRLVRAPDQKVKVLLHCKRYAEKSTQKHLKEEYLKSTDIGDLKALENWLNSSS